MIALSTAMKGGFAALLWPGTSLINPDITRDCGFFRDDGIHLLDIGNNIFINTVQGGLEKCLTEPNVHVFP
jgi:hypothetical protein